jgi:hypothetical protein
MKGKSGMRTAKSHTAYSGGNSKVASEMMKGDDGFKRGGKTVGKDKSPMSMAHAGRKPRKSGGGVLSSASGPGTPRGKASHY